MRSPKGRRENKPPTWSNYHIDEAILKAPPTRLGFFCVWVFLFIKDELNLECGSEASATQTNLTQPVYLLFPLGLRHNVILRR